MKKRIFITMHYLELGGAEISLIGLLQALDYSKYDVDLFVHRHQGELMPAIPPQVHLLPKSCKLVTRNNCLCLYRESFNRSNT